MKKNRCIIALLGMVPLFVFYKLYTTLYPYNSDFYAHYGFAINLKNILYVPVHDFYDTLSLKHILGYPVWHVLALIVNWVLTVLFQKELTDMQLYSWTVSIVNFIFLIFAWVAVTFVINKRLNNKKVLAPILATLSFYIGPYYLPGIGERYYLGAMIPNVLHNPTVIAVKFMAIIVTELYIEVFEQYQLSRVVQHKKLVLASMFLAISGVIKPSFYQMFVPAIFVYCVILFLKSPKEVLFLIKIGISVVPVTLMAIAQYLLMGLGTQQTKSVGSGGIGFGWMYVWKHYSNHPYIALVLSILFPAIALLVMRMKNNISLQVCLSCLILAFGMFCTLYLKIGPFAGDFAWGAQLSVWISSIYILISIINMDKNWKKYMLLGLYFGELIMGCGYMLMTYYRGGYMV